MPHTADTTFEVPEIACALGVVWFEVGVEHIPLCLGTGYSEPQHWLRTLGINHDLSN
jgi:hypothetical protein